MKRPHRKSLNIEVFKSLQTGSKRCTNGNLSTLLPNTENSVKRLSISTNNMPCSPEKLKSNNGDSTLQISYM